MVDDDGAISSVLAPAANPDPCKLASETPAPRAVSTSAAAEMPKVGLPYPVPRSPPQWSMDTLGGMAFAHICQPTAFDTEQLQLLARYPFVQFDKQMNTASMPTASQEDRFIAAARQVKSVSPSTKVLLYLNGL